MPPNGREGAILLDEEERLCGLWGWILVRKRLA